MAIVPDQKDFLPPGRGRMKVGGIIRRVEDPERSRRALRRPGWAVQWQSRGVMIRPPHPNLPPPGGKEYHGNRPGSDSLT